MSNRSVIGQFDDLERYLRWLDHALLYDLPASRSQIMEWINADLCTLISEGVLL